MVEHILQGGFIALIIKGAAKGKRSMTQNRIKSRRLSHLVQTNS